MAALGISATVYVGLTKFDYFIEVADEATVRALQPDFAALGKFPVRGIIVTSRANSAGYDFVSRFFGPAAGINEDPVTGSAHSALTPYWRSKLDKEEMVAYQASARGGTLRVREGDGRVFMRGQAVTVLRGELVV